MRNPDTEVGYLFAHGVRLARLHFVESGTGFVTSGAGGADAGAPGGDAGATITISGTASDSNGGPIVGVTLQIQGSASKTTTRD